jgi:hypothetical protein
MGCFRRSGASAVLYRRIGHEHGETFRTWDLGVIAALGRRGTPRKLNVLEAITTE